MTRRRIVAGLIAVVMLVSAVAIAAWAHTGSCNPVAGIARHTGNEIGFNGRYECFVLHDSVTVTVSAQRRTPGQAFQTYYSETRFGVNGVQMSHGYDLNTNCAKDYRTLVKGIANPGNHQATTASSIIFHRC